MPPAVACVFCCTGKREGNLLEVRSPGLLWAQVCILYQCSVVQRYWMYYVYTCLSILWLYVWRPQAPYRRLPSRPVVPPTKQQQQWWENTPKKKKKQLHAWVKQILHTHHIYAPLITLCWNYLKMVVGVHVVHKVLIRCVHLTLALWKNCLKQPLGSSCEFDAISRMNCITTAWCATCSISASFCRTHTAARDWYQSFCMS